MANFPTDVLPSDIKIGSHYQTTESTTQSYRRRVATRGGHRWSFELSYNPQKQSAFSKIFAFKVDFFLYFSRKNYEVFF